MFLPDFEYPDFQYGFRSSQSTADLFTVLSDRIARAFSRSGATRTVALDRIWHAVLLHKLRSYGISGQTFGPIYSFLSNRQLQVVLGGKSLKEYPVNAGVPQGSIISPTFSCYTLMSFLMMLCVISYLICLILLFILSMIRHLWYQLKLTSELQSDLQDTEDMGRNWLVDFNAGKIQLILFNRSNNTGAIDVKIDRSVHAEKTIF